MLDVRVAFFLLSRAARRPLGVLKHTRVASVDGIAVVVCANMARYCVYSGKGEPAIFYLTVGLRFDAGVWALFASPRRVTALEKLAERELAGQRRMLQSHFTWR